MLESQFQRKLVKRIKLALPGCVVLKNDPNYMQGIPDLIVLFRERWAALEVKKSKSAPSRVNQDYYIKHMNSMSFAAYVYPENEDEVLHDLQQALRYGRKPRVSKSKQLSLD